MTDPGTLLTVSNILFSSNLDEALNIGGTISSGGSLMVSGCTFSNNSGLTAGAILSTGSSTVIDSTFIENLSRYCGAIMYSGSGTSNRVSGCTFARNVGRAHSGAIFLSTLLWLDVDNSTFVENRTGSDPTPFTAGAIKMAASAQLTLSSVTIHSNSIFECGAGGIMTSSFNLTMDHTIVAGNIGGICYPSPAPYIAPDIRGPIVSGGFNLIGSSDGTYSFDPSDLIGIDPLLGPLQDNGGADLNKETSSGKPIN